MNMMDRIRGACSLYPRLLPGLAVGLLAALAVALTVAVATLGRRTGHDGALSVSAPARLPECSDVARLYPGDGRDVRQTAHVEAVGGQLQFAPPPLGGSSSAAATKGATAVPTAAVRPREQTAAPPVQREPMAIAPVIQSIRRLPPTTGPGMENAVPGVGTVQPAPFVAPPIRAAVPSRAAQPASPPETPASRPAQVETPSIPRQAPVMVAAARPPVAARRSLEWQRQMGPVATRADGQIRDAFETCGRGALFAGRSEMIQALRLIAQNADSLEGGGAHSDALAAGMRALEEAESFSPRGSRLESELDMTTLVASHRTPVVREALAGAERGRRITPLEAQNRYYTYAQQKLAEATAGLPIGAVALYGLGKIHGTLAAADSDSRGVEEPRAMTLYQAALIVDPGNPLAAHELGVMLARNERYDEALAMLQHSAMIASLPETWQNLSRVHERRGEADLARRAKQEADNARTRLSKAKPASHPALARGSVRWLDAEQFAQTRPADSNLRPAAVAGAPAVATAPAPAPESSKPSGILSWLPWGTKR